MPRHFMLDEARPYVLWDALCELPAAPESFATVEAALEYGRKKMEAYQLQGYYSLSAPDRLRIAYDRLKLGVLWKGLSPDEIDALTLFVVDDRVKGGFVTPPQDPQGAKS